MENSTLFPREEKAELLFEKILKDPEACRRLTETFYESMDADTDIECGYLPPEKFAYALLDAYKNRDLTALLMAICQNSMFDLLRNSFLAPFRFNADGQENPVFLTDEKGNFLREKGIHVSDRDYDRFRRIYREKPGVKMYLAYGYRKRHAYDEATMEVEEYKMGEHIGVLLVYELPNSVKEKETYVKSVDNGLVEITDKWQFRRSFQELLCIMGRILWRMVENVMMDWAFFSPSINLRTAWKK